MAEPLRELLDRRQIEDLLIDYCRHLDRMALDELAELFTTDCRVTYGPDPRLAAVGREALAGSLARMWRWRRTAHHLANVRVWLDRADTARAESYVHAGTSDRTVARRRCSAAISTTSCARRRAGASRSGAWT
ncbi:MAG: nuclear transport factor 2 family protein [Geminicoccaceae bacterium]